MRLVWERDKGILHHDNYVMVVSCIVRNELNGRRGRKDPVVRTENADGSDGVPYFPRPFPPGLWRVTGVLPKDDPYLAPYFISTDAHQLVERWTEVAGHYGESTGEIVEDYGYGLHCSTSISTLGCGRITMRSDLLILRSAIMEALVDKESVELEVV